MTAWAGVDWIYRAITGRPIKRLSQITPRLYVGGQPSNAFLGTLYRWNVTGVVNLRGEYNYELEVRGAGLDYLHLPTVDNEAPTLDHLMQGVAFINDEIGPDSAVYIHCWEGLGRGPTMAAAYLVSQGQTPQQAWATIREARPFIRPTDTQIKQLERFAAAYPEEEAPTPVRVETTSPQ